MNASGMIESRTEVGWRYAREVKKVGVIYDQNALVHL